MRRRESAWAPHPARLFRRSRWRVAAVGALAVTLLLAVLSAGAYLLARNAIYVQLQERLEVAATHEPDSDGALIVDERGQILPGSLPDGVHSGHAFRIMRDAELGVLAVLRLPPHSPGPRVVATPAAASLDALSEFLLVLVGLCVAGGLAALPIGYFLSGRALQPLEAAVRERSEFVARASHQLRTPLAIIRTSADLALASRGLAPDEALTTIRDQTERMESLAARLTELGRAGGAPAPGNRVPTDLDAIVGDAVAAIRPAASQRGIGLELDAAGAPLRVRAQPDEIRDLLAAVLENAVKFSPPDGAVQVRLMAERRRALIEIADRGPGIAPDEVRSVTLPFFQGRRTQGGHGLGLAIALAIAERQGGRLTIDSQLGKGTTVRIALPTTTA